jgi:hypothetical protein
MHPARIVDLLLWLAILALAGSVILHVGGLPLLRAALQGALLSPKAVAALTGLWVAHALQLALVAAVLILAVRRPQQVGTEVLALVLVIPIATAIALFVAVGSEALAAWLLLLAGLLGGAALLVRLRRRP